MTKRRKVRKNMDKNEVIELSPSSTEKDGGLERTCKRRVEEEDDETPLRHIFCLKKNINMKQIEEREDCFILDFNPSDSIGIAKLSVTKDGAGDDEVSVLAEKGQVACRDYPHSRDLCLQFPFATTPHEGHCHLCYCYVCDIAAPCEQWVSHCHATGSAEAWQFERKVKRSVKAQPSKHKK